MIQHNDVDLGDALNNPFLFSSGNHDNNNN